MTTTVVKTIGSTGDYSTLQAWEDACPASLVAVDQIWQGQCQNQTHGSTGNILTIAGTTTDSTRYLELTTVAGASFADQAGVQTTALRADAANGAYLTTSSNYISVIDNQVTDTRINKLQLVVTAAASNALIATQRMLVDRCIMESNGAPVTVSSLAPGNYFQVNNSLHAQRGSAATKIIGVGGPYIGVNNTYVVPSDKTAATYGVDGSYATATLKNCAVFGATNAIETANSTFTKTTCRTDAASPPAGFTQIAYDTSTGSGFQNTLDATRDFRIKSTSAMLDVGTTDATNAATDIAGTARPSGSGYDVGCWEYVQTLTAVLSAATATSVTSSTATPRVTVTY